MTLLNQLLGSKYVIKGLRPATWANSIATFDIETATGPDGNQLTIAISGCSSKGPFYTSIRDFINYSPNGTYSIESLKEAHHLMWFHFFENFIFALPHGTTIYAHNLGGYDGVLLAPMLTLYLNKLNVSAYNVSAINPLVDDGLKYITIGAGY